MNRQGQLIPRSIQHNMLTFCRMLACHSHRNPPKNILIFYRILECFFGPGAALLHTRGSRQARQIYSPQNPLSVSDHSRFGNSAHPKGDMVYLWSW